MHAIEALESRIAPAVIITNPLPNITVGIGKTGASIDLGQLTAPASSSAYHTKVEFVTNYDTDPIKAGIQGAVIDIELYDDKAPLTVQNFLAYVNNANARGDYDGTLFHRALANFVLQGGGYETPGNHIPTLPSPHNEPDSVNRPNVAGTIAMAKGNGPNTATSEWFINLADNSSLDAQNGGFTVFGKVLGNGLQIAKDITALPQINVDPQNNGGTPVQNGVSIKVVDAKVIPATAVPATDLKYTVAVSPVGTTPTNLLAAKVSGSKLLLNYTPGKSGLANVTVTASDGTTSATSTFTVELRPNFIGSKLVSDTLPGLMVPGDTGVIKVNVGNGGGSTGSGTVNLSLIKVNVTKNGSGRITGDYTDDTTAAVVNIGSTGFTLASGRAGDVSVPVTIPAAPFGNGDNYYRVAATVVPNDTPLAKEELYSDDNAVTGNSLHDGVNRFGTFSEVNFGSRTANLKYAVSSTDAKPATVTWAIKGPGSGTVTFDSQGNDIGLAIDGTSFSSSVTPVLSKNASRLSLASVDISSAIGTAGLGLVDLTGPLSASGGVKSLTLGNVTGQSLFSIGAPLSNDTIKASLNFGNVVDLSLSSNQAIASLSVAKWVDTDSNKDSVRAPSIGTLTARGTGNFEADVTTDSETPMTLIVIGGVLQNSTISAAGDIGAVKVGAINKSSVFAGVTARPTALADFTEAHKIASFTTAGIAGFTTPLFVDSQVAAQTISKIAVKNVATAIANGAGASGFVADVIGSYSRTGGPTKTKQTAATTFDDEVDGVGGYVVKVL